MPASIGSVATPPAGGSPLAPTALPSGFGGKGAQPQTTSTLAGNPALTAANNYGKMATIGPGPAPATMHPGASVIRGSAGGIGNKVKTGAIGPGKVGAQSAKNTVAGAGPNQTPPGSSGPDSE